MPRFTDVLGMLVFGCMALLLVAGFVLDASAEQHDGAESIPIHDPGETSEYYDVNDVRLAMIIIGVGVLGVFLYLARDVILRRKTDYEKKDYASKQNRDYEKYHSDWNTYDEDFIGPRRKGVGADEASDIMQGSALPDYYAVLGVPVTATQREIKVKFRKLVKEYHPDKTKDEKTAEKLTEINKAYEVLSDEEKRKTYDSYFRASVG